MNVRIVLDLRNVRRNLIMEKVMLIPNKKGEIEINPKVKREMYIKLYGTEIPVVIKKGDVDGEQSKSDTSST